MPLHHKSSQETKFNIILSHAYTKMCTTVPCPPPRFELWNSSLGVLKENWAIMGMIDANHTGTEAPASLKCLHPAPSFSCSVSAVSPRSRGNMEKAFLSTCRFYLTDLSQSSLNVFIKIAKAVTLCAVCWHPGEFFFNKIIFHYEFVLCVSTFPPPHPLGLKTKHTSCISDLNVNF